MKEFDLINRYFSKQVSKRKDVVLGIGDDCALLSPAEDQHIAVTTDTLVCGVHFPEDTSPRAIGHKAVAVNLSDLAAVGAEPTWISLALTLPEVNEEWLSEFATGVFELCEFYNVQLVGGDTTQGPLSITITAQGIVPKNKFLSRSNAKSGDWLYVTGTLGDAALALKNIQGKVTLDESSKERVVEQLDYPKPRVLAGQALRDYATSAIDISDGLLADLKHICECSNVGAKVNLERVPVSKIMLDKLGRDKAVELAVSGGDDYELLFTVSEDNKVGMETALSNLGIPTTCIGQLTGCGGITTLLDGEKVTFNNNGFEHSQLLSLRMPNSAKSTVKFKLSDPIHFLALGFGSGLSPKAPGTFGTLAAIPVFFVFTLFTPLVYLLALLVVCIAGIYICGKAAADVGVHDHGAIVWDEIAGFLITMFLVPVSWQSILVGFILFRVFDIFKPWPISYLDKYVHGGFGIMVDDIVAGLMALACMHFIF